MRYKKKSEIFFILCLLVLFVYTLNSCGSFSDPQKLISDLNSHLITLGIEELPEIEYRTTEYLIYYDGSLNTIFIPSYNELETEQINFIDKYVSGEENFIELFNWFFIAHEYGHVYQFNNSQFEMSPFQIESEANRFAVQFLIDHDIERLIGLRDVLLLLKQNPLLGELATDEAYFNSNYLQIPIKSPELYLLYQIEMILYHVENGLTVDGAI
jgi:hypothetical protein